jgi:hypothetical protein
MFSGRLHKDDLHEIAITARLVSHPSVAGLARLELVVADFKGVRDRISAGTGT